MPIVRTAKDLGLVIRSRRRELGLDQATLAKRVGATRQWVIDIEKGKPRAELALAIRALRALDLYLSVEPKSTSVMSPSDSERDGRARVKAPYLDIDDIVEANRDLTKLATPELPQTAADYLKQLDELRSFDALANSTSAKASASLVDEVASLNRLSESLNSGLSQTAADYLKQLDELRSFDALAASAKASTGLLNDVASLDQLAKSVSTTLPKTVADQLKALEEFRRIDRLAFPSGGEAERKKLRPQKR